MADRKVATCQVNLFPESKEIKYYATQDCTEGNHVGNMKQEISTSRVSGEQASESVSTGKKHGSTLVFEGNSKCHDPDMQSSGAIASAWTTPVKSDISTEVDLPLGHGSFEMEARKKHHQNVAEDSLHTVTHDSQHRTESSCSNSFSVVLPVALSNNSCQEISKEAYSSWNYVSSMDSSNSKAFDRRSEEPVTASYESGVSGQIARKAIRNARARNSMTISPIVGSQSSLPIKKGDEESSREWSHVAVKAEDGVEVLKQTDMYKWISGNTSSVEEEHAGTVERSSIFSGNSDKFNFSSKTVENIRSCDEHDNLQTFYSGERLINSGTREESENILAIKGKPVKMGPEVMDKIKGDSWANESSESSMTKYSEGAVKDQVTFIAGFDLNEDIDANGTEDCIQPVVATISSHRVIHVVAKAGRLSGQPTVPLKFEGRSGWKGSAETSAFLPAVHSKSLDKKPCSTNNETKAPQGFTGIDLNIAALEDSVTNGMPMEHEGILQDSHSEVDSKRSKNLWIDLNCLYDAADEFTQPSLLPVSENHHVEDLNLNVTTSEGYRSYNLSMLRRGLQSLGNKTSDYANPGKRDFNFTSHHRLVDLSSMQHVPQIAYAPVASPDILQPVELMQRVASLQPKLPFMSHTLPPHSYPSKGPIHFGPVDPLPSSINISGTMPYPRYPHEHGVLPEVFNPGTAHMSLRTPHFLQVVHGQGTGNITASTHKLDLKTEENLLSTEGTKMNEARQFLFLAKKSPMGEHLHPEAWSSGSMKRKEPEGGLEFYQLGHKQVN